MKEDKSQKYEREVRSLRDWIVPSTLFIGASLSILLFVFTMPTQSTALTATCVFSIMSIVAFVANLLTIFVALGEVEMDSYTQDVPEMWFGWAYLYSCIGILTFLIGISLLCFSRSTFLGVTSILLSVIGIVSVIFVGYNAERKNRREKRR